MKRGFFADEGMDKRQAKRFTFRVKAQIQSAGSEAWAVPIETWTRDVSAKGVFLEMEQPLAEGTRARLNLELPALVTGRPVMLRCTARVVRVAQEPSGHAGVGAVIENYEFVRTVEKPRASQKQVN